MSKSRGDNDSPIRRISKDEKTLQPQMRRAWPDKKHLASEQNIALPKPGEKNKIQSILIALPFIMLMIGLYVYFKGESAQNNGAPIVSEMITREGEFKSISEVSGIGTAKYYLWYVTDEKSRGVRVSKKHARELSGLSKGDVLTIELVPRVEGSNTLWAYRVTFDGVQLIDMSVE